MSYKKLGLLVLLGLAVVVGILIYVRDHVIEAPHPAVDITDLSSSYQASEEIEAAKAAREQPDLQPAEVVTPLPGGFPVVALVFDGLPERPLASRLIDVLARHKVPAVFFAEGTNAADQPETVKLIHDAGQELGNYTFVGVTGLDRQPVEEQIIQICRAQKAIAMLSGTSPQFFRAPRIQYGDEILKSVRAAGIPYAVKENIRVPMENIRSPEAAVSYGASIPPGSILSIPVTRFVEPKAVEPVKEESDPAVDMKPTIKDDPPVRTEPEPDLADQVDWLLSALEGRGIQIAPLNQFRKIHYIPIAPQPKEGE